VSKQAIETNFICLVPFIISIIKYQRKIKKPNPLTLEFWTNYQENKNHKIETNLDAHIDGN
jgi:hypothetical protein